LNLHHETVNPGQVQNYRERRLLPSEFGGSECAGALSGPLQQRRLLRWPLWGDPGVASPFTSPDPLSLVPLTRFGEPGFSAPGFRNLRSRTRWSLLEPRRVATRRRLTRT